MMKIRRNEAGVTMIEILIGVVIIGILAAMAVPRFQVAADRLEFQSQTRTMTRALKLARSLAVSEKDQFGVHYDDTTHVVTLFKDLVNVGGYDFAPGDSVVRQDSLSSWIMYVDTDVIGDVFLFQPNGSCRYSGSGHLISVAYSDDLVGVHVTRIQSSTGKTETNTYYY
jgi:prepilin-type N-terminal cleavage/methylation domain-containing protein